jgi:hypothetical protein
MAGQPTPRDQAMSFWGVITRAASEHRPASELGGIIRDEAARLGQVPGFAVYSEAQTIYSQAVGLRNASARLGAAPGSDAITGSLIAQLPYGTGPSATGPRRFHVRVAYDVTRNGEPGQDYITLSFDSGNLPLTVGELRQEAEDVAASKAGEYGSGFVGLASISIGEL